MTTTLPPRPTRTPRGFGIDHRLGASAIRASAASTENSHPQTILKFQPRNSDKVYVRLQSNYLKFKIFKLGLVADPVIEAIARLEFEDGLRTGVLPGGCWYPCGGHT